MALCCFTTYHRLPRRYTVSVAPNLWDCCQITRKHHEAARTCERQEGQTWKSGMGKAARTSSGSYLCTYVELPAVKVELDTV